MVSHRVCFFSLSLFSTSIFVADYYANRMSLPWLKNMLGVTLSDEDMENIPYPKFELITHVTIKDVQAFGLLGSLFFAPISAVVKKQNRNWPEIKSRMGRYGRNGMILGLITGPLMTYFRLRSIETEEEVTDRCYRLRKNRDQVRVDQASVIGGVAGAGLATFSAGTSATFGGVVGMSSGVILAAIYNAKLAKK